MKKITFNKFTTSSSRQTISTYFLYAVILMLVGTLIYSIKPYPSDDFLRHIRYVDYKALGGYSFMFPYSYFETFHFNPWYGFDLIAGLLNNGIGPDNTVIAYEIFLTCLFIVALLFNFKSARNPNLFSVTVIIVFLFLSYAFYRISLIRPAIFISVFLLLGLLGKRFITGLFLSIFCAFFYWLYWLCMIPLALAHYFQGSKSFAWGLLSGTISGLIAWGIFTDFEYFRVVFHLLVSLFTGRGNITINENVFSIGSFSAPILFLAIAAFVFTVKCRKNYDLVFYLILFTLPLAIQIRYLMDITFPLLVIYAVNNNIDLLETLTERTKPVIEAFGIIAMVMIIPPLMERSTEGKNQYSLRGFDISVGSIVLTDGLPSNFYAVYYSRSPIKVIPSAEIAWNDTTTKKTLKAISEKPMLDNDICNYLQGYGVNYVVSQKESIATCLKKEKTLFLSSNKKISLFQFFRK